MSPLQTLRVALRALVRNLLRSLLTALGIVIGVAAVIAMVAIGEGARSKVEETFAAMGSNLLVISPGSAEAGGARSGQGSNATMTWDDLRAIQEEVPSVKIAAPVLRAGAQVVSEDQNWQTSIQGTTPDYLALRSWPVDLGSAFTQSDLETGTKVALLGETVVEKLFGSATDPVGQAIRIRNIPFTVLGVLGKKGQSPYGQDLDDVVLIPATTFRSKIQQSLGNSLQGSIFVEAIDAASVGRAQRNISGLLRDRHHLSPAAEDDFQLRNLAEAASAQEEGTRTLTALLASIAAVSLLVGGIGIMNIMLVSVTERTREIGIRMALGATPANIMLQFLVESLALSVAGGLLGIALGIGGAFTLAAKMGWPVAVNPSVIGLSVGFSAIVGIGFGLYPAYKASQLDPIVALRWE